MHGGIQTTQAAPRVQLGLIPSREIVSEYDPLQVNLGTLTEQPTALRRRAIGYRDSLYDDVRQNRSHEDTLGGRTRDEN
jgi:hypothetical protein